MRTLLTVEDKMGIETLARGLPVLGAEIISTGATRALLEAVGVPVRTVADVTGYPAILGGRVTTLHQAIIQPGGSTRDDEVIRMANRYGIAKVTTGQRPFRH